MEALTNLHWETWELKDFFSIMIDTQNCDMVNLMAQKNQIEVYQKKMLIPL